MNKMLKKIMSLVTCFLLSIPTSVISPTSVVASTFDPFIVVSLGDSYSSGEGIEPFYGQNEPVVEKIKNKDWIAHRSAKSWPSLLKIPGIENALGYYKDSTDTCQWYFKAASGATTINFTQKQNKELFVDDDNNNRYILSTSLEPQLSVFDDIEYGTTDYVTLTIGGNDVGFAKIMEECATKSSYLKYDGTLCKILENIKFGEGTAEDLFNSDIYTMIQNTWDNFEEIKRNLRNTYETIIKKAGPQARIIVAGYPMLLDNEGKGAAISEEEAKFVNLNVKKFNNEIFSLVLDLQSEGNSIYYVDVEKQFRGHQAFSSDPWINGFWVNVEKEDESYSLENNGTGIQIITKHVATQDINKRPLISRYGYSVSISAYSMHPNETGAQAYAKCVNEAIEEIEKENPSTVLNGTVSTEDGEKIANATVQAICQDTIHINATTTDENGEFSMGLYPCTYNLIVTADGYENLVEENLTVYPGSSQVSLTMRKEEGVDDTSVYGNNIFQFSDWTIDGKLATECTQEDILTHYAIDDSKLKPCTGNSGTTCKFYYGLDDTSNTNNLQIDPILSGTPLVEYRNYKYEYYQTVYQPEFRDLKLGDDCKTVLEKLGFSEYGINEITAYFEDTIKEIEENRDFTYDSLTIDEWMFSVNYQKKNHSGNASGYLVRNYGITYFVNNRNLIWEFDTDGILRSVQLW